MKNNKESLRVSEDFRANTLRNSSNALSTVEVVYEDGLRLKYDRIVFPIKYASVISDDFEHGKVKEIYINGDIYISQADKN
jgi:hypothetical protein